MAGSQRRGDSLLRRYPPLVTSIAGVAIAVLVLPSALNVPLTNPSQTLEYAPVPPQDDAPPPDSAGNAHSLSLGSSGLGVGAAGGGALGPGPPGATAGPAGSPSDVPMPVHGVPSGVGTRPVTKRCVGNPPRQTEDALSPPCVAFFDGDNGGATAVGVTRDEVRVLVYLDEDEFGCGTYEDLGEPSEEERFTSADLRTLQRYFNARFQTYNRFVRFVVFRTSCGTPSPESRRADAAATFAKVKPFAVLNFVSGEHGTEFDLAMAARGVLNFGGNQATLVPGAHFRRYPGRMWGHLPTMEQQARLYGTYVCRKVVPHPVTFGNRDQIGERRVLGLLYTADPGFPNHLHLRNLVKKHVERCGGNIKVEAGHLRNEEDTNRAAVTMAQFRQEGVTTVLWTGHFESNLQRAAAAIGYTPEVVALGQPGGMDEYLIVSAFGTPAFMRNAWLVTNATMQGPPRTELCGQAILDTNPEADENEVFIGCQHYPHVLRLFVGIQSAGPRTTPEALEQGLRAIPSHASKDAKTVACFYEPGDYSCVKDAAAQWWDPQGKATARRKSEEAFVGCWRLAGDRRYLAGTWPQGDVLSEKGTAQTDPCNSANGV